MERYMYQEESFERMLKQKSDEYRMYPSDNVWINIQNSLKEPRRFNWKAASFFTTLFVSFSLFISVRQHQVAKVGLSTALVVEAKSVPIFNTMLKSDVSFSKRSRKKENAQLTTYPDQVFADNLRNTVQTSSSSNDQINDGFSESEKLTPLSDELFKETSSLPYAAQEYLLTNSDLKPAIMEASLVEWQHDLKLTTVNNEAPLTENSAEESENKTDAELNYEVDVPLVITKKPVPKIQYYITPSASYRVLVSDNRFNFGNLRAPESAVNHHASFGFEAGAAYLKPINKSFTFTSGLQLNYTSYIVTASRFSSELTTVTLNSFRNIQRVSDLRTSNGYFPAYLSNKTFQASIPLGVQVKVFQQQKLSFNLATTIQPTFLISATGYLVTNDLKNYIKAPEFMRTFNLNYSFESFVRWKSGRSELQLGPQFRYQLLSNSKGNYPIQEHLVDYGFKIGFIRNLK